MHTSPEEISKRISEACRGPWLRGYVKSKLRTDPLYEAVVAELIDSAEPLLDIGCGIGLLGSYLRLKGWEGKVTGVDFDPRKIKQGQKMRDKLGLTGIDLKHGLAEEVTQGFNGNVAILDVLQYLDAAGQEKLLNELLPQVSLNGKIIIRSGLYDDSRRFRMTQLGDWFGKLTFWMKESPVHYPSEESLKKAFTANGLTCQISPLWGNTPFNNYLIVGTRKR